MSIFDDDLRRIGATMDRCMQVMCRRPELQEQTDRLTEKLDAMLAEQRALRGAAIMACYVLLKILSDEAEAEMKALGPKSTMVH